MTQEIRTTEDLMKDIITKAGGKLGQKNSPTITVEPAVEQPTEQVVEPVFNPDDIEQVVTVYIPTDDFPPDEYTSDNNKDEPVNPKKKSKGKKYASVDLSTVQQHGGYVKQHPSTTKPLQFVNTSDFIELENLCLVQEKNTKFYMEKTVNGWRPVKHSDMPNRYPGTFYVIDDDNDGVTCIQPKIDSKLKYMGHAVSGKDLVYTYGEVPQGKFNLLIKDFCELVPTGEYSDWFEVLIRSLCNNNPEKIEHLEKLIWVKYINPADNQLPCPVILDCGGSGKGLLVEKLLPTIFGKGSVEANMNTRDFLNTFADFAGKAVIHINEGGFNNDEMEMLKNKIGSSVIRVEEKFQPAVLCDNTALYIITSNKTDGAIQLSGSTVDRRWSVFINEDKHINLHHWVNEYYNRKLTDEEFRSVVRNNIIPVLQSRDEVGKWLYALNIKYQHINEVIAYKGADYKTLLNNQQQTWEQVANHVFNSLQPGIITVNELYEYYNIIHTTGKHNYKMKNIKAFSRCVNDWLKDNNDQYEKSLINERIVIPTTKNVFIRKGMSSTVKNDSEYTKLTYTVSNITKPIWSLGEYPNQPLYLQCAQTSGKTATATITKLKRAE